MLTRLLSPIAALTLLFASTLVAAIDGPAAEAPRFQFGLVADIQHADKDARGKRNYRESLDAFGRCIEAWRDEELAFTIQLGDLIDGRGTLAETREDLDAVLGVYASLQGTHHRHVLGNHCLTMPRPELERRLGLDRSWYSFVRDGWRFIVLDSLDLSLFGRPEGSPQHARAAALLAELQAAGAKNAEAWNGGLSLQQLQWLDAELTASDHEGSRAVVLSHLPVLAAASSEYHLLWNHDAVRKILNAHDSAHAFLAGHDHAGGYAVEGTVHHLTVPGLVEAPVGGDAYAIVKAFKDRLLIDGVGIVADRVLERLTVE